MIGIYKKAVKTQINYQMLKFPSPQKCKIYSTLRGALLSIHVEI
jgi:hypothetical protein